MKSVKVKILKNEITLITYDKLIANIFNNNKLYLVSPIASQTLVLAYLDNNLKTILDKFDCLVPDSQWVKRSAYFLYQIRLKERIYGPDLTLKICRQSEVCGKNIFLYGTTPQNLRKLEKQLILKYPKLSIVGSYPSVFREATEDEIEFLAKKIVKNKAEIVFIGMGSPLQEKFTITLSKHLNVYKKPLTIIPVGAAFDFISENKPQAPKIIRDLGFEWLFRLLSEPRRLWKRYLYYGLLFVFLILKQKIILSYLRYNR